MSKLKLQAVEVRTERKKKGELDILVTKMVDISPPCKQCKKGVRKVGSSRCSDCTLAFKKQSFEKQRLQTKIKNQLK